MRFVCSVVYQNLIKMLWVKVWVDSRNDVSARAMQRQQTLLNLFIAPASLTQFWFRFFSVRVCALLLCTIHQSNCRFATDFNCKEIKQSSEYVDDVKTFVRELADHFNTRKTPKLDLSTIGLGFVNEIFLTRNYQHFLALNLSANVLRKIDVTFLLRFPNIQKLDLSRNCLTTLDVNDRLAFIDLQSLNFSRNLLTSVHPFTFSNLSLNSLDLSYNRLIRFWIADYEINQLHLNDNKISQVEIDSGHFKEMKLLDARNNRIRIFQVSVDFENLMLSNNQLTLDEYFSIRNVYGTLDLSRNHISEFDWKIISCVTNLNLAFNRLSMLQLECRTKRYQRVERLNLDGNFLCNFDQSANVTACLPNLKFISLLNNRLTGAGKIKAKSVLTTLGVKSQIFDYDFFPQLDDDCQHFGIFKNWAIKRRWIVKVDYDPGDFNKKKEGNHWSLSWDSYFIPAINWWWFLQYPFFHFRLSWNSPRARCGRNGNENPYIIPFYYDFFSSVQKICFSCCDGLDVEKRPHAWYERADKQIDWYFHHIWHRRKVIIMMKFKYFLFLHFFCSFFFTFDVQLNK